MTKSRFLRPIRTHLVSLDDLPERLIELLTIAPRTKHELSSLTGWSAYTIVARLDELRASGAVYFKGVSVNKGGVQQLWHAGDEPSTRYISGAGELPKSLIDSDIKQRVVTTWAPVLIRDPLLWALHEQVPAGGEH